MRPDGVFGIVMRRAFYLRYRWCSGALYVVVDFSVPSSVRSRLPLYTYTLAKEFGAGAHLGLTKSDADIWHLRMKLWHFVGKSTILLLL